MSCWAFPAAGLNMDKLPARLSALLRAMSPLPSLAGVPPTMTLGDAGVPHPPDPAACTALGTAESVAGEFGPEAAPDDAMPAEACDAPEESDATDESRLLVLAALMLVAGEDRTGRSESCGEAATCAAVGAEAGALGACAAVTGA